MREKTFRASFVRAFRCVQDIANYIAGGAMFREIIGHVEKSDDLIGHDKILSPAQLRVRDDTRPFPLRQSVWLARLLKMMLMDKSRSLSFTIAQSLVK